MCVFVLLCFFLFLLLLVVIAIDAICFRFYCLSKKNHFFPSFFLFHFSLKSKLYNTHILYFIVASIIIQTIAVFIFFICVRRLFSIRTKSPAEIRLAHVAWLNPTMWYYMQYSIFNWKCGPKERKKSIRLLLAFDSKSLTVKTTITVTQIIFTAEQ